MRCLIELKSGITCVFSHNYAKIKMDSVDDLSSEETLSLHNFIILINLVFDKDQSRYYYNIFLQKCSYQLAKK